MIAKSYSLARRNAESSLGTLLKSKSTHGEERPRADSFFRQPYFNSVSLPTCMAPNYLFVIAVCTSTSATGRPRGSHQGQPARQPSRARRTVLRPSHRGCPRRRTGHNRFRSNRPCSHRGHQIWFNRRPLELTSHQHRKRADRVRHAVRHRLDHLHYHPDGRAGMAPPPV